MPPAPPATPPALPPELREPEPGDPSTIGPFRVVGRLGAGGMGVVYGALDDADRCVAVKVIKPDHAGSARYRALFAREAALLARIDAECAPRFLGADPDAPSPWLATEFVPGRTLRQRAQERAERGEPPLTGDALVAFAAGTAEALAAIHAAGVVHLDVKPGNIMLSPDGPRVLDFGIARAVEAAAGRSTHGTPGWVSPERLAGDAGGPAADMFAWGGLVAYAATGRPPFGTGPSAELAERVRAGEYDIDGVPDELRGLVERALSADPEARPTAVEALDAVLRLGAEADARARRARLRALLDRVWTGFDAAGHRPAAWVAMAGALALATSSGVAGGTAAAGKATGAAAGGSASGGSAAGGSASAASPGATATGWAAGANKGVLAAVAAVTALVVAAGAWTIGRITTDQPVLPLAGTGPEETAAAEEPPAPATQTVEYRGLELTFPADWTVTSVQDVTFEDVQDPTAGQVVDDFLIAWAPDQADCAEIDWAGQWAWRERNCVHVKILGPGAIIFTGLIDSAAHSGRSITEDDERGMFYPSTQGGMPCPSANGVNPYGAGGEDYAPADDLRSVEELGGHDWGMPLAAERVTVRGEDALYREYPVTCVRPQDFPLAEDTYYLQRSWFLPGPQILVVDEYGIAELDEVMAA
ncbi:serine/threonine protein kinase [Thermobifida alba]|uniref:Serine/threonine protein kinase n=1 Tax=Thermobifida alba TaxID=53522 RepID=A0ABY4L546_THEAE|nr:serine/threonine-protein kinase [Thermobifida alba]UPT21593.1 serine/threonine protein kinase [Thermobifida alba]